MTYISETEFNNIEYELDDDQRVVLKYLAEVREKNSQNPWVSIETLGAQIGGISGKIQAETAVLSLNLNELVGYHQRKRNMVAISDKGFSYVKFFQKENATFSKKKYYFILAFVIVIAVVVSIITGSLLYLFIGIVASVIGGIILFIFQKP